MLDKPDAGNAVSILVAGLLAGVVTLVSCVSFALLIFSGELTPYIALGISMLVATVVIAGALISLTSGYQPMVAMPDDDTAPIMALMVSLVIASLPAGLAPNTLLYTAMAALALTALVTGLALAALGAFRMGSLVRYLPYSVMGGYFAGAGLLLIQGSLRIVTDLPLDTPVAFLQLLQPEAFAYWVPTAVVALCLRMASTRLPAAFAIPCSVLALGLLFFVGSWLLGVPGPQLMAEGWLLGPFPSAAANIWNPLLVQHSADIHWPAIIDNIGSIATIAMISAISLMFTASGLSLMQSESADINRELTVAGVASAVSGLGGGVVALPSLSVTKLAMTVGAPRSRLVGLVVALVCALILFYGMAAIAWFPKPVLAGLLMFLGWSFVEKWLIDSRQQLPGLEYLVVLIIISVVATIGFIQGVVVGLLCAIGLFVVNYSRINVVRHVLSGSQRRSNVERVGTESEYLLQQGSQIHILKLQGYLFFGTAAGLVDRVNERLEDSSQPDLTHLAFDFAQVSEMDSSASLSFMRIAQEAVKHDFQLLLTGMTPRMHERLLSNWFEDDTSDYVHVFPDLDRGLEWCEERVLANSAGSRSLTGVLDQLQALLPQQADRDLLFSYLEHRAVAAGDVLANQGEASDTMFLLENCSASVFLETETGRRNRIRRTAPGTVFGEVGFFLGTPRSATVVVDEAGDIYILHRRVLAELERDHPRIASALQKYMLSVITRRLLLTTRTLRAVLS